MSEHQGWTSRYPIDTVPEADPGMDIPGCTPAHPSIRRTPRSAPLPRPMPRPERRSHGTRALAIVTALAATATAVTAYMTTRGEGSKVDASPPPISGERHPGQGSPPRVVTPKGISLANAKIAAEHIPAAVVADERSLVLIEKQFAKITITPNGEKYKGASVVTMGSGYVAETPSGLEVMSAAHVAKATNGSFSGADPYMTVSTNVDGTERTDIVKADRTPASYNPGQNTAEGTTSVDLAELAVAPTQWEDNHYVQHGGANGFGAISPITLTTKLPAVGTLVYDVGERNSGISGNGMNTMIAPPQTPEVNAEVVVADDYGAGRALAVPVDQAIPIANFEGDSGGPELTKYGFAWGTLIGGGRATAGYLSNVGGVQFSGVNSETNLNYTVIQVNNASDMGQLYGVPFTHSDETAGFP